MIQTTTPIGDAVRKASSPAWEKVDAVGKAAVTEPVEPVAPTKTEQSVHSFKAVRFDEQGECGVIVGIGGSIGKDRENDEVEKAALRQMAQDFLSAKAFLFCANHDEGYPIDAERTGTFIGAPMSAKGRTYKPGEEFDPEDPPVAIDYRKGSDTHWFFEMKPSQPAILEAARKGEIVGFSWAGRATKAGE